MNKEIYVGKLREQQSSLLGLLEDVNKQIDNVNAKIVGEAQLDSEVAIQVVPKVSLQSGVDPCEIWNIIKGFLVGFPLFFTEGILDELYETLEEITQDDDITNCKLKGELEKALDILEELIDVIETLNCIDRCEELVGKLFCILVELILEIIEIIAKIIILLIFCNSCGMECSSQGKVAYNFCKCLTHELSEELCDLDDLIEELSELATDFIECTQEGGHHHCDDKPGHHHCNCKPDHNKDKHKCECGCKCDLGDCYYNNEWNGKYMR